MTTTARIDCVDGVSFAPEAARLLNECFAKPSIDYTPEYVAWQLTFPGDPPATAIVAFYGHEPVGFVAMTPRRLRLGSEDIDGFFSSFFCMRPIRGRAEAAVLLLDYQLEWLWKFQAPFMAFGYPGGAGERVFPYCCRRAGFLEVSLGLLLSFGVPAQTAPPSSSWEVAAGSPMQLPELAAKSAEENPSMVHVHSTSSQLAHYAKDPRERHLLIATNRDNGEQVAAWAIRTAVRTANGLIHVPSLDSVFGSRAATDALPPLLWAAAGLWPQDPSNGLAVVNAPSLAGFAPEALRALGIRQSGQGFLGHLFLPPTLKRWSHANATATEVV